MIIVCSLKDHVKVCVDYNINYLISVIDPGFEPKTPNNVDYHLKLGFDDIEEIKSNNFIHRKSGSGAYEKSNSLESQILPNNYHINKIIDFVSKWDQSSPIAIHCWCGVSRSMATAIYVLCKLRPNNIESNIKYIRSIAPHANPNKLMISMFEKNLNIEGKILNSLKKFPYTVNYDCDTNFAPISIFNIDI
tara:strand:+ start:876 stop:1448 length:573 start_codon:yes stop_codon:yes gene_type:complete